MERHHAGGMEDGSKKDKREKAAVNGWKKLLTP